MQYSEINSVSLENHPATHLFDEEGFLVDPEVWSEALGAAIAHQEGLGVLSTEHWRIIHYLRGTYLRLGGLANLPRLCRGSGLTRQELKSLFGDCLVVWRIAGLPHPGEEAKTYLSCWAG